MAFVDTTTSSDVDPSSVFATRRAKIVLFANTDWYLYNFRLALAARLREVGYDVLLVSPQGEYASRLTQQGFRWRALPMDRRSLNPFAEARLLWRLADLLRAEKADLVHGFTIKSAVYGALAGMLIGTRARVLAVAGLGHVFTSFNLKARLLRASIQALLKVAALGRGACVILQNPDDERLFLAERIVAPGKIRMIMGSGVDCQRFQPREATPDAGKPFRVLLASRLLWSKGIDDFVAAAELLRKEGLAVEFLLAGEPDQGNPAAVPIGQVRNWADVGLVTWLGHVDDMPGLLRSVHAFALPTRYGEGVPRCLIEAAACGLPILTTDTAGCRELVSHGVEGLYVTPSQPATLAQAIRVLASDSEMAAAMGRAARQKALRVFDQKSVLDRTLEVYDELLVPARGLGVAELPARIAALQPSGLSESLPPQAKLSWGDLRCTLCLCRDRVTRKVGASISGRGRSVPIVRVERAFGRRSLWRVREAEA